MLSDKQIIDEKEKGNIVIHPFTEYHLGPNSYDVTLGKYYYSQENSTLDAIKRSEDPEVVDIYSLQRIWRPHTAQTIQKAIYFLEGSKTNDKLLHVLRRSALPEDTEIIYIRSGERILCHTQEFIGGLNHITTMIKARSSVGRSGISICMCAGSGDVGYINRWTLEVTNHLKYDTFLVVGARVGQILFFFCEEGKKGYDGKYRGGEELKDIMAHWSPASMLPLLYDDVGNNRL